MKVFLSYNRADAPVAETVADDVRRLGHAVWYDREVSGGQAWWSSILQQIRDCDLFLFIMTVKSLDSEACVAEYTYASQLRKRTLPVLCQEGVRVHLLPPALSVIQFVDYRAQDKQAAFSLVKAFEGLPKAVDLPHPLPAEPPVPMSYLGGLRVKVMSDKELSFSDQSTLVVEIKQRLKDPELRQDALDLLRELRGRKDLLASVADEIDTTLEHSGRTTEPPPASRRQPQPAPEVVYVPQPSPPAAPGIGRRLLRWAVYAILALIGLGVIAEMTQERQSINPVSVSPLGSTGQLWCCDMAGFKRCPMAMEMPLGSQCICPGQGTGFTCQ